MRSQKIEGGGVIIVVDTHLRHDVAFALKCVAKIRENIGAALKKYPGASVIVMGDMNHDRSSPAYREMEGVPGGGAPADGVGVLTDSFDYSKKMGNVSWGNWHAFTGVSHQMWPTDLIFASGAWESKGAELVRDGGEKGLWPSDHFFVRVELERR